MADDYETVLLVKNEVFVYNIPPRQSTTRGYRASDWNLGAPDWTGRMRLVSRGSGGAECTLKLEDKLSGELFAKCPVDTYPGLAIQAVADSSRYFVVHIKDDSGRSAYIGIGFADRSDSFDLNVALQDHFKWVKKTAEIGHAPEDAGPQLDLKFKEGQTINIKMNITKSSGQQARARPKQPGVGGGLGILPPPPGGVKLPPPPGSAGSPSHKPSGGGGNDLLLGDLGGLGGGGGSFSSNPFASSSAPVTKPVAGADEWGEFSAASSAMPAQAAPPAPSSWVQF